MPDGASLDQAASWADDLLRWESRGPGDTDNALRRLARRYGVAYATLWALRYRRPKDLYLSAYNKLAAAYRAERQRQFDRLAHDIEITKAIAGPDGAAVAAAEAVVQAAGRSDRQTANTGEA
ncbi:hypothetical protein [Methylopila sp. 73B]|uniref:hypothetical protein n=1 Tax=Methylopila sp. 73B TaxID=1120792 RepID=UPI0003662724|nr:hypothetical protein [Methylopila sp. 73B]